MVPWLLMYSVACSSFAAARFATRSLQSRTDLLQAREQPDPCNFNSEVYLQIDRLLVGIGGRSAQHKDILLRLAVAGLEAWAVLPHGGDLEQDTLAK